MPELRELTSDDEWERAVPILRQLWSHCEEAFVRSWREDEAYRLLGWFVGDGSSDAAAAADADRLVAVAGVYLQTVLHHERSCWIHDFVVDEAHRGRGHGEALLAALEEWAGDRDCAHVALVCDADNEEAAAFYEDIGMRTFGTVYETEL